jgi:hypothetical protein
MGNDGNMDVPHGGRSVEFLNSTGTAMEITSYSNRLKMVNRRVGNGFHSKLLNYRRVIYDVGENINCLTNRMFSIFLLYIRRICFRCTHRQRIRDMATAKVGSDHGILRSLSLRAAWSGRVWNSDKMIIISSFQTTVTQLAHPHGNHRNTIWHISLSSHIHGGKLGELTIGLPQFFGCDILFPVE